MKERYIRQERIKGWDQGSINKTKIAIIGESFLSDILTASLVSMGLGEITVVSKEKTQGYIKNPLTKINKVKAPVFNSEILYSFFPDPDKIDIIVDCTNNKKSKKVCLNYAKKEGKPIFLGSSNENSLVFCSSIDNNENLEDLVFSNLKEYENKEQGKISSTILAAIITDEIRKTRVLIRNNKLYDKIMNQYSYHELCHLNLNKKILQIGAGAIGTFTGILLALTDSEVDVVDFDKVEESNLNRQFLFYDSIEQYKAEIMAKRLNEIKEKENFRPIVERIDENWKYLEKTKPDLILGCVDNAETRFILNDLSTKYRVPYIDGGTSLSSGGVASYIPKKNACIDCQIGLKRIIKRKRMRNEKRLKGELNEERDVDCIDPSMIVPNQIIGALMINEAIRMFDNKLDVAIHYRSGKGITRTGRVKNCYEECKYFKKTS